MIPPTTIEIRSDGNTLSFLETIKLKEGLIHKYQYSKSKTKKGTVLELSQEQLDKLIRNNQ